MGLDRAWMRLRAVASSAKREAHLSLDHVRPYSPIDRVRMAAERARGEQSLFGSVQAQSWTPTVNTLLS
jgi:hypothetical protein